MASEPRRGLGTQAKRKLSTSEASFYASVYGSAQRGSLAELCSRGCSEEEAEEFFATAFERVMETVDPIERNFTAPEMVNFIKRAAWRCMIDERRRRGQRTEIELTTVHSLSDTSAESPDEVAEAREAVAIGREALQMLPERDRLIFRQRHQMNLSPEEILQNMPGLSLRTYRKIIQRANARVLDAFQRIEGGERCEEMGAQLLGRYIAGESSDDERDAVAAHLAHCRACQQAQARMRGYLVDVAGVVVVSSGVGGARRMDRVADLPGRLADFASGGPQSLLELTRAMRERVREFVLRIASGTPSAGGEATVGQALTATSVKVASACVATVTAGACVAAGVVPGVGGLAALQSQDGRDGPVPIRSERPVPSSLFDQLPAPDPPAAKPREAGAQRERGGRAAAAQPRPQSSASERSIAPAPTPSDAEESGTVTGNEFGAESKLPATPTPAPSSPAPAPPSGGGSSSGGQPASPQSGGGSEFGI